MRRIGKRLQWPLAIAAAAVVTGSAILLGGTSPRQATAQVPCDVLIDLSCNGTTPGGTATATATVGATVTATVTPTILCGPVLVDIACLTATATAPPNGTATVAVPAFTGFGR